MTEYKASDFEGQVQRLSAKASLLEYWKAGGMSLGLYALFVLTTTQTCRLYSDFWVR